MRWRYLRARERVEVALLSAVCGCLWLWLCVQMAEELAR